MLDKGTFIITVLEILLSKCRSVLWPGKRCKGSKRVKVSVFNQKVIVNLLKLLEKWLLTYNLRGFWILFKLFWFCLKFWATKKFKNSILEMPIITEILNINNLITRRGNYINLHTIRELIEHSSKNVWKGNVYDYRFEDIAVRR